MMTPAVACELSDGAKVLRAQINEAIGLPVFHDETVEADMLHRLCNDRFCLLHSAETKTPVFVVERLDAVLVTGTNTRPKVKFVPENDATEDDEGLPAGTARAVDDDYRNSGYARGHMAPSNDSKCSKKLMKNTFVLSNAVPQIQNGFNGSYWRYLEDRVHKLAAKSSAELFVITGPVAATAEGIEIKIGENMCGKSIKLPSASELAKHEICDANDDDATKACEAGVAVPAGLFKVIYTADTGRAFAFLMPNINHSPLKRASGLPTNAYLDEWRVSLDILEELTDLEFFPDLTLREQKVVKENCVATRWR
ncbi:MAG: DNA/RNA non-specific endonuclease [Pikeienuella sp.]